MTWVLTDDNGTTRKFGTRAEAEEEKTKLEGIGANVEIEQQGASTGPVDAEVVEMSDNNGGNSTDTDDDEQLPGVDVCAQCGADIDDGHCPDCDSEDMTDDDFDIEVIEVDGTEVELPKRVVDEYSDEHVREIASDLAVIDERTENVQSDFEQASDVEPVTDESSDELPNTPDVTEDPISWMPEHFVDVIEGVPAINRKGYAVLAEHFDISVRSEPVTYPGESDWEYAEFRATAVTPDGDEYTGYGSAHVERGDDKTVLGELAETRACKRSISWATGVGMVAVSEMQGDQEVVE
jgi:RNA polymerase subunit RPABC4/transcription elongation factor Spt4